MTTLDDTAVTAAAPSKKPKSRARQALQIGMSVVLVLAVVWYVKSNVADFSDVWREIRAMTTIEIAVLAAFAIWNLVTYWIITVVATPGMTYRQAAVQTEATTAIANTVPAGGAVAVGVTYAMLGSWGFSKSRTSLSVIVSGIWNNFAKLGMPIAALAFLALQGQAGGGRIFAAVVGLLALVAAIVVFAMILRSQDFAARAGIAAGNRMSGLRRLVHKGPVTGWDLAFVKFRARVIGLVRHRWISLSVWTLIGHLSLYAVLVVTLRQVGVSNSEVNWAEILAVFAFARLLTAIPLTPGGLGIIELALISGLTTAGGDHAQVVAAVLVYRILTYVLPIPIGLVCYLFWRRNKSWLDSAPPLDPKFTAESVDDYVPRTGTTAGTNGRTTVASRAKAKRMAPWAPLQHLSFAVAGLAVLALCGLIAHNGKVGAPERRVFRWINDLPQWLYRPMWLFQQYGNLIVAFGAVLAVALLLRRWKLGVAAVAAVALKLSFERVVKQVVERQRPGTSIGDDITLRGANVSDHGLSFVSGHAVMSSAVATILMPLLSRRWRWVVWALVACNGIARIYVGAHNPLDVVGGVGLGIFIGGLLNAGLAPRAHDDVGPDEPLVLDESPVIEETPEPVNAIMA